MVATYGEAEVYSSGSYEILLDGLEKVTSWSWDGIRSERTDIRLPGGV